ncbi:signal transduction histidine kinase [Propioniferax innocua]|uniref:histidine kinase n=2 Tax=Propioniferax innocua TaxID=1753 RepID=A0A542ZS35_9ACTN|nr:signal transduction histidine kinase [Propioniferax innocua]
MTMHSPGTDATSDPQSRLRSTCTPPPRTLPSTQGPSFERWRQRHPRLVDALVIGALASYNVLSLQLVFVWDGWPSGIGTTAASIMLFIAYALRRNRPWTCFAVALLVAFTQLAFLDVPLVADVVLVLMVYHLATRSSWSASLGACIPLWVWIPLMARPLLDRGWMRIGDILTLSVVVLWAWTWGTLTRVRRAHEHSLLERAEDLQRQRETQARFVAVAERTRIAREMHDIVAHGLGVMVVLADGAAKTVDTDPDQARHAMERARDTGRDALGEMRRMLGILRSDDEADLTPQPGLSQLDRLLRQSRDAGLPVELTVDGTPAPLPDGVDLAAYRVIQESLTNVRKHADLGVTRVAITVSYRPDVVRIHVWDDGTGPAGTATLAPDDGGGSRDRVGGCGHGLVGMRERVHAYGGTVRAGPRDPHGFEVVAELPRGAS